MNPHVVTVEQAQDGQLVLRFSNGERRHVDLRGLIARGRAFELLAEAGRFASARVVAGSVEWPGGIDLSYHTLDLMGTSAPTASAEHPEARTSATLD
ncbi:MAG: hypothetical protein RIT45_2460 [Pseudomonadota bacterium]|jgi:hypothetical protein